MSTYLRAVVYTLKPIASHVSKHQRSSSRCRSNLSPSLRPTNDSPTSELLLLTKLWQQFSPVFPGERNEPHFRGDAVSRRQRVGRGSGKKQKEMVRALSSEPMARILAPSHFSQQPGISWTSNGGSWRRSRLIIRLITAEEIPVVKGDDCTHRLAVTTAEYYAGSKDLWYILKAWWNKLDCKFANRFEWKYFRASLHPRSNRN